MNFKHEWEIVQITSPWFYVKDRFLKGVRWIFKCPECATRPDRLKFSRVRRWDQDPIAVKFGFLKGRCGRCGKELS